VGVGLGRFVGSACAQGDGDNPQCRGRFFSCSIHFGCSRTVHPRNRRRLRPRSVERRRRVPQAGEDVVPGQLWVERECLRDRHVVAEQSEDGDDGDPGARDAGHSAHDRLIDDDTIHGADRTAVDTAADVARRSYVSA